MEEPEGEPAAASCKRGTKLEKLINSPKPFHETTAPDREPRLHTELIPKELILFFLTEQDNIPDFRKEIYLRLT